ncbi:VCBS repeat-containing protein [Flavobacteriaceae bacterium XHP0103]|nr:VCBS repeat-containing protein [Marixanthotalea marina]
MFNRFVYSTNLIYILSFLFLVIFYNCSNEKKNNTEIQVSESKIFNKLDDSKTGIEFINTLTESDTLNYFTYGYLYMGGGVAVGDINNDGLVDVYFTGNQVQNKLYLNKGNLEFEDITNTANVGGGNAWYTGVTMADVNDDGLLDIYCSVGGQSGNKRNELYINNGDLTFTEKASEYGLADEGNSVQATFFDYDKDGDLDVYVANYPPTKFSTPVYVYQELLKRVTDEQTDHLYRNDGGVFVDVTEEAGVKAFGLSLSATVGDVNNDGWDDIYVSNDFSTPDYFYINNQDGTFKEVTKQASPHTAFYGMGADIADINNDGNLDIFQVDMDANNNRRKKANMASMNPQLFWDVVDAGYHYQYMNNVMQINTGVTSEDGIPYFSNVSGITGTTSTDWSWGPLMADFDNDGKKDLYVTNGTRKEINHNDYFKSLEHELKDLSVLEKSLGIPSEKIDNFMFKNNGDLNFEKVNEAWGIELKGFSNGVAYADFDNDGDLELIINNIDDNAVLFENRSSEKSNYISIAFDGKDGNKFGLGNRIYVTNNEETQMQELTLTRGFQSSVAPELHFGLGQNQSIEKLKVVWSDGKVQELENVAVNQKLKLKYTDAVVQNPANGVSNNETLFATVSESNGFFPKHKHQENVFDDFETQVLLPHKMSSFGPALVVGDLNNDGLDDYYVGGASGFEGNLFYQNTKGTFTKQPAQEAFIHDKDSEDLGALIVDVDNDGDNDLYVVSGGYEFLSSSKYENLQDRLYINDGKGNFSKANGALPEMTISGSRAYAADFNKDGKQDILTLGRQVPGSYPSPTDSYVLFNESDKGSIKFSVASPDTFKNLGMATSAIITDFDNDTWDDIIIVGEWMPIRVFKNVKNGFREVSEEMGLNVDSTGWWWSIKEGDFDNDGDMDYIVGNNGLNYKYKANENETFDIYVNDFDDNNQTDIVLSYYSEGVQYPVRGRSCSSQQIPSIKDKFKDYEAFAQATLVDVYTEAELEASLHYQVKSFASIYLENRDGQFIMHNLPNLAQISSINQILVDDYDADGNLDVLIAGNLFVSEVETPRNDAGYGLFLKGNGKGGFKSVPVTESGFFVPGDVKDLSSIKVGDKKYIIAAKNNDYLQFIEYKKS